MDKFVGNLKIVSMLKNIISLKTIGHAYMFSGVDGIGKMILAKEFAKAILCDNSQDWYCNNCESCKVFDNSPDFQIIEKEDDLIKVDAIRQLGENIMLKPTTSNRRVFIINDAECMNESAQNALLKILEEPPSYATIILITSNKERIIRTIKSRCTIFEFAKLKDEELKSIFEEENISKEMLEFSNGSAGKYLKLKNSNYIDSLMVLEDAIPQSNLLEINRIFSDFKKIKTIKEDINDILDLMIVKLGNNLKENSSKKIEQIELIEEVRNNIKRNANFEDSLDYLAIRLWEINSKK